MLLLTLTFILASCQSDDTMTTICESVFDDGHYIITTTIESVDDLAVSHEVRTQITLLMLGVPEGIDPEEIEAEVAPQLTDGAELVEITDEYIVILDVQEWETDDEDRPTVDELIHEQAATMGMSCRRE